MAEVNLKSPATAKAGGMETSPASGSSKGGATAAGSKDEVDARSKQKKRSDNLSSAAKPMAAPSEGSNGTRAQHSSTSSLAATPQRSNVIADLPPQVIVKKEIKTEIKEEEEEKAVDMGFLMNLCQEAVGRGVVGMKEVKDQLLMRQLEAGPGSTAVPQEGVSEVLLERALELCGAVEVGRPAGKKLFARPLDNSVRIFGPFVVFVVIVVLHFFLFSVV